MTEQPFGTTIAKLGRSRQQRIEDVIRAAVPEVAPALAVSIWSSGAPWYEAYAGWTDPEQGSGRVGFDTLFDLASVTKVVTATAFLRLHNDFKVELEDPIIGVIPEFGASRPRGVGGGQDPLSRRVLPTPPEREDWQVDPRSVNYRQLLTHTSGLAPWRDIFEESGPTPPPPDAPDPTTVEVRWAAGLDAIAGDRFVARPGEEYHYSDLGYILLGVAVSRIFGGSLPLAIQALIRDRLGLDALLYRPLDSGRRRDLIVPTSLDVDWRGRRCWGEPDDENAAGLGGVAGHAGLFGTVHDLARFGMAWLRTDPRLRMERVFKTAVTDQSRVGAGRGLGWMVQPNELLEPFSDVAYGHTGFTGTSLVVDPDRDLVVALLTNRGYADRTSEGIEELRAELHRAAVAAF